MRLRARHVHAAETFFDNVVGLAINFGLVFVVYNWMLGQDISVGENLVGSTVFFFVAWARKYTIRRWSSNLIQRIFAEKVK